MLNQHLFSKICISPVLQAIDVDATHRNMRHKVNAYRSLWIERGECEIRWLIWQIDEVAQFLLHGLPHLRSLMDISSTRYRTPLHGELDGAREENLDATHCDGLRDILISVLYTGYLDLSVS